MRQLVIILWLLYGYNFLVAQSTCDTLKSTVLDIYNSVTLIDSSKVEQLQNTLINLPPDDCEPLRATILVMLGNVYTWLGAYENAEERYKQGLVIREKLKDHEGIASVHNNLSNWAIQQEQFGEAIKYANTVLDSLQIKETISTNLVGMVYINRAAAYQKIKEFDSSKSDYDAAKKKFLPSDYNYGKILQGLGDGAWLQTNYQVALTYYEKAKSIYTSYERVDDFAKIENAIGACYYKLEQSDKAQQKYESSLNTATEIANPLLQIDPLTNLIELHTDKGEIAQASKYELVLEKIIREGKGAKSDERYVARTLEELYNKKKNYKKALEFSKKAYVLNNTIRNQEEQEKRAEIRAELESERKNQKLLKGIIGLLFLLMLATFGIFWQRRKRKKEASIAIEKERAAKEREATIKQEFETYKKKETITHLKKGRERVKRDIGGLATDLHDEKTRVAAIKRDLEYVLNNVGKPNVAKVLDNAIDISNTVFFNLRKISLALRGSFDWSKQMLYDIEQLERKASIEVESKNFNIDETIDDEIGEELSKVFGVLLDNIHQHAEATKVSVDFTRIENEIVVLVEDNGNGFDPDTVTYNVGLKSVKDRVEKTLKGKLDIDAAKGRGAIFIITIPL